MELIDDEGNLFGRINVIDALAILLVIAVAVAGIAVLAPGSNDTTDEMDTAEPEPVSETRYATVDLGTHPNRIANQITTGDTVERNGHNLTVTDVYVAPTNPTTAAVVVRAELDGELVETESNTTRFVFAANQSRVGDSITIETDDYTVRGPIQRLDDDGRSLNTEYQTVGVEFTNINQDIARAITEGTTQTRRGEPVITVESVTTQPAEIVSQNEDGEFRVQQHPTNRDVSLTVELRTLETESGPRFYGGPLRLGNSIRLDLGTTTVTGTISGFE